jgi:hypothetical protein
MVRVQSFVAVGIAAAVAVFVRQLAMQMMGPGSQFYQSTSSIQFGSLSGAAWSASIYEAVAVWVPWIIVGGAIIIAAYQEVTRQRVTVRRGRV